MLSNKNRLSKKDEIARVFKSGRSFYSDGLGIRVVKNNLELSRFCFIVSSKVSKKAVDRNRIKRQLRNIILLKLAKIKPGFDFLVLVLPTILGQKSGEIDRDITAILNKLGLILNKK